MIELIQQEPNWMIRTLAGFILGYFFTYMVKGINYIWRRLFTNNYLAGRWISYYQTWENDKLLLRREHWTIKPGFNAKLKVNIATDENISYTGELLEERGHLVVILKAKEFNERVFCRYPIPIPGNDSTVVGLYLGTDWNGHAAAGISILSRTELPENKLSSLMKGNAEVDEPNGMIRLQ